MSEHRIFTGIYDLKTSPFAFDFITFLAMCQAHRAERGCDGLNIVIVPSDGNGFAAVDYRIFHDHQFPIEHAQWRLMNIFLPALGLMPDLHGVTICLSRDHARQVLTRVDRDMTFPRGYDLDSPPKFYWTDLEASALGNLGYEFPGFRAPAEALGFIDRWIEMNAGGREVVSMTLREGIHGEVKNSNIDAWVAFARSLDPTLYYPVFVPDMVRSFDGPRPDLGGFPVFSDPTSNMMIRMALYERSYIAMFTSCGPVSTCFYNGAVRYLIFKCAPPYHKNDVPWGVIMGLNPVDNSIRVATPYQKRFDAEESCELLRDEFDALAARIEADPADAFRRHVLRRTDIGPALVDEVSAYLSQDSTHPSAVEYCQRYLARYPNQLDQAIAFLARSELITTHDHAPVLQRSRRIYEAYLARTGQIHDEPMISWALAKTSCMMGDMDQFDRLIDSAPQIRLRLGTLEALHAGLIQAAVVQFNQGHGDKALHIARRVNELHASLNTRMLIAMLLEGTGQFEEARTVLHDLLSDGIDNPAIYEALSRLSRATGDVQASIEYMHQSMKTRKIV